MRALARTLTLLLAILGASACMGLSHRVDRALLDDVPNEELLVLFDAENGVYIARDDADLAARSLEDAKKALRRAVDYEKVIAQRRTSGAAIDTVAVLDLLGEWNHARIDMREREVALREEEERTSTIRLFSARARYEEAKARLVKDKNPAAGSDIDLVRFEAQVREWQERENAVLQVLAEREEAMLQARERYIALALRLQDESHGAYGGPWADLLD